MPLEKLSCVACGAPISHEGEQDSVVCSYCSTRNYFKPDPKDIPATDPRLVDLLSRLDGKLERLNKPAAKAAPAPVAASAAQVKPPAGQAEFVEFIRQMARSGKKIEAIKLVRERTNSSLTDAKNYVESL